MGLDEDAAEGLQLQHHQLPGPVEAEDHDALGYQNRGLSVFEETSEDHARAPGGH